MTAGQDHGARFGLRGSTATIGRGPVMDIVLTDPRVSRRHARVRVDGVRLMVEDLASTGGTAVNGVAIEEPTAIALGDRLTLGDTELTVVWTPTAAAAPPAPRPPPEPARPPAAAPATPAGPAPVPEPAPGPAGERALSGPRTLLPAACLVLGALSLLCLWLPAVNGSTGTRSLWGLDPSGLRLQAGAAALATVIAGGLWLRAALAGSTAVPVAGLAALTAAAGGLVAGLPSLLLTVDLTGRPQGPVLVLLSLMGTAVGGLAVAGVVLALHETPAGPADRTGLIVLAGGGIVGGALAIVACTLTWISTGGFELGSRSGPLSAGGWLIPVGAAIAIGCTLTVVLERIGEPARAAALAAGTTALAAAAFSFASAAAIDLGSYRMEAGLSLALAGTAMALVSTAIGTASLTLAVAPRPEATPPGR